MHHAWATPLRHACRQGLQRCTLSLPPPPTPSPSRAPPAPQLATLAWLRAAGGGDQAAAAPRGKARGAGEPAQGGAPPPQQQSGGDGGKLAAPDTVEPQPQQGRPGEAPAAHLPPALDAYLRFQRPELEARFQQDWKVNSLADETLIHAGARGGGVGGRAGGRQGG